jgi:hypothetical protein
MSLKCPDPQDPDTLSPWLIIAIRAPQALDSPEPELSRPEFRPAFNKEK